MMFETEEFSKWFKENTPKEGLSENTTFTRGFLIDAWNNGYNNGYKDASEWHDLRKNPNDLPTENMKQVVVKTDDNDYSMGWYCIHQGKWWYDECPDPDDEITNVIKWKEIKED